jgi:hypothetical protein
LAVVRVDRWDESTEREAQWQAMNIVILDDYQDAVRKLRCAA